MLEARATKDSIRSPSCKTRSGDWEVEKKVVKGRDGGGDGGGSAPSGLSTNIRKKLKKKEKDERGKREKATRP